ncbi:MAG: hypothetical protein HOV70_05320 [Streptomyces sp.]|nr:hypothetical protein [Streptomyces sp.]
METEIFLGNSTEQHVEIRGDLRAHLAIMWDEFLPTVGGRLRGRALVPEYVDLDDCGLAVDDPVSSLGLSDLLAPGDTDLHYERLIDRLIQGRPAVRGGRRVTPLDELPPHE